MSASSLTVTVTLPTDSRLCLPASTLASPSGGVPWATARVWTVAPVRRAPLPTAALDTQALPGEGAWLHSPLDDPSGWVLVQLQRDRFVGYVPAHALQVDVAQPAPPGNTHWVTTLHTFAYPLASIKAPPVCALPLGSHLCIVGDEGAFARTADGWFVWAAHLAPLPAAVEVPSIRCVRMCACVRVCVCACCCVL